MDRLLCGDVGYGKTEVAIRAAFKAVLDGKQVAVLAPTTILAEQHLDTFRQRFEGFPVEARMLSRFTTAARGARRRCSGSAEGQVDLVIGTHRLLSSDVALPRPRPGHPRRGAALRGRPEGAPQAAAHRGRRAGDVGDADPAHPQHVAHRPARHLADRDAAARPAGGGDLGARVLRGGGAGGDPLRDGARRPGLLRPQPGALDRRLRRLAARGAVPEARVVVAHGQMAERALEKAMRTFLGGEADVLLATAIIENGLDIPNANTLLVNRADRFGLAQLYQLRGRVGRSERLAFAYFLVPPGQALSPTARARLAGDPGVLRARRRLPDRGPRPRDPRRRQPARRRAARLHGGGRLRDLLPAARGGGRRARGTRAAEPARGRAAARPRAAAAGVVHPGALAAARPSTSGSRRWPTTARWRRCSTRSSTATARRHPSSPTCWPPSACGPPPSGRGSPRWSGAAASGGSSSTRPRPRRRSSATVVGRRPGVAGDAGGGDPPAGRG